MHYNFLHTILVVQWLIAYCVLLGYFQVTFLLVIYTWCNFSLTCMVGTTLDPRKLCSFLPQFNPMPTTLVNLLFHGVVSFALIDYLLTINIEVVQVSILLYTNLMYHHPSTGFFYLILQSLFLISLLPSSKVFPP